MNLKQQIQDLKSKKDNALGQIEVYKKRQKELKAEYLNLQTECSDTFGIELNDLDQAIEDNETKLSRLVNDINTKLAKIDE